MVRLVRAAALAAVAAVGAAALPAPAAVVQSKAGPVNVEPLAKLEHPWGMTFLPDGRLLITEKPGRLRIYADGKLSEPVAGVPQVHFRGQGGLLDVEIDPDFAQNQYVYLSYSEPAEDQQEGARDSVDRRLGVNFKPEDHVLKGAAIARGKLEGNKLSDVKVIWRAVPKTLGRGHFGGRIVFSPDGKLFYTSGERQRFEPAQDLGSHLGKVIRINPDGTVPTDNPFVNQAGALPEIWTYGNRNPLGAAIDPKTKQLWVNEMGPKGGDEFLKIERGENYGWPVVSEGKHYDDSPIPPHKSQAEFAQPDYVWNPVISPSGMIFYNGSMFPAWRGLSLNGGLSSRAIVLMKIDGDDVSEADRLDMKMRVRDLIEAPDGAVLILSDGPNGELLRLTPGEKAAQ